MSNGECTHTNEEKEIFSECDFPLESLGFSGFPLGSLESLESLRFPTF